jgi:HAD superfamily hydrolase (TIGR01509 family)
VPAFNGSKLSRNQAFLLRCREWSLNRYKEWSRLSHSGDISRCHDKHRWYARCLLSTIGNAHMPDIRSNDRARIEAVIFDIDGTLVDSVSLHAESWQLAFEMFGKTISFADIRRQIGKGADQLLPVFLSPEELKTFGADLEACRSDLFKRQYLPRVKAFPGVRRLFERLRQNSKRIALASSAKADELEAYKKIADISDLVETETASDDIDQSKPHPDIFDAALARLPGVSPQQSMVVGDTPYDAVAAVQVGLRTIGLLCGGWSEEELRRAGCIAIYRDPADLLAHYGESPLA